MTSPTFSVKLFVPLIAVVMVLTMTLGLSLSLTTGTHAAGVKFHAQPRFFHFANRASDTAARAATTRLPYWSSSFTSGGTHYTYSMVGTNPTNSTATTTVPTSIVPLKVTFSGGRTFNGTQKVASTKASPIFQRASFSVGTSQYGDAIQRAEFWKYVSWHPSFYHVLLGAPTVTPTVNITVPAAYGSTQNSGGTPIGVIDLNWFDAHIQPLLTSHHFTTNILPVFLTYNVFLYQGDPSNCCIIGYHNAVTNSAGLQTYIWASYNDPGIFSVPIEDVNALSHEVSEWYNDPFVSNAVPPWSVPSEPQYGCTNLLEVGDPLVGVVFTVNGYHLQDEAYFSWFARQKPAIGFHRQYTYLGTFTTYSPSC
ncbi:MAG: hypothetical protein M3Y81_11975 [Chloroflexota bacterium]|nr:hypothetical protein [Chloroflexota bacterium]